MITARQTEMLVCLANGITAKEVAARLGISAVTVRNHVRSAYRRLDVQTATAGSHSLMEAFRVLGWLRPPEVRQ